MPAPLAAQHEHAPQPPVVVAARAGDVRGASDAIAQAKRPDRVAPAESADNSYRIGEGDVLSILVWKEPDVSIPSVVVRPDGKIAMPLIKEVEVRGLTQHEVEQIITARLAKLVRAPDVTVVVTAINSKKVYVVGAVRKEGPITLQRRMTILQTLSEAGGLTEFAKKKKIYVLRNVGGVQRRLAFNYNAVIKGEHMQQNILVQPDDTIVVPH